MGEDVSDEGGEGGLDAVDEGEIAAPAAEVDAGEDELVTAGGEEAVDLGEDLVEGQAARVTAGGWDDAEGAAVGAALLDFEVGAGLRSGKDLRLFNGGVGEAVVGPDGDGSGELGGGDVLGWGCGGGDVEGQIADDLGEQAFVAVADYGGDSGEGG